MKEIILEFLKWMPDNIEDIFELVDDPEKVVDEYLKENEQLCVECKTATTPMPDMMCEPCYKAKTNR